MPSRSRNFSPVDGVEASVLNLLFPCSLQKGAAASKHRGRCSRITRIRLPHRVAIAAMGHQVRVLTFFKTSGHMTRSHDTAMHRALCDLYLCGVFLRFEDFLAHDQGKKIRDQNAGSRVKPCCSDKASASRYSGPSQQILKGLSILQKAAERPSARIWICAKQPCQSSAQGFRSIPAHLYHASRRR